MTTPDEGVREIQLSGKQLVFVFMAVTVVSVVIFLCGVLVGRGVYARTALVDAPVAAEAAPADAGGAPADPPPTTPTSRADVSFPERLGDNAAPKEKLVAPKEPAPSATAPSPAAPPPAPPTPSASPAATSAPPAGGAPAPVTPAAAARTAPAPTPGIPTEPKGSGYAIQVAAFSGRGEAETIVKRLADKGYAAYLVTPQAGQPAMFRVRIGKFQERAEAERVASRLEREEQFKPWITR